MASSIPPERVRVFFEFFSDHVRVSARRDATGESARNTSRMRIFRRRREFLLEKSRVSRTRRLFRQPFARPPLTTPDFCPSAEIWHLYSGGVRGRVIRQVSFSLSLQCSADAWLEYSHQKRAVVQQMVSRMTDRFRPVDGTAPRPGNEWIRGGSNQTHPMPARGTLADVGDHFAGQL